MDKLNEALQSEARKYNACNKVMRQWPENGEPQNLIDLWKSNMDFAIAYQYPSNDFIKENFDRELLRANLVFVDEDIDMGDGPSGIYVINGDCTGVIRLAPWSVATLYVRHGSDIRVEAGDFARIFVRLYDDSDAEIDAADTAIVKVYDRRRG